MSIRATLLLLTLLIVLVPLGVAFTCWRGLARIDAEIAQISEEYAEATILADAEAELGLAANLLRAGGSAASGARVHLEAAESTLLGFLESQAGSASPESHQSDELRSARSALDDLRGLREASDGAVDDRVIRVSRVESALRSLRGAVDGSVRSSQATAREIERSTLRLVIAVSVGSSLLFGAIALWTDRGVMRKLRDLHRSVAVRSESERTARRSDAGAVITEIDAMSERMYRELQDRNREILRRERVAGIGLLAADVAHELRNPLNAMLGLTELSLRATGDGPLDAERSAELHESLSVVRREAIRCREIVDRLMAMVGARSRPLRFDCAALLAETVQVARAARPDKAVCFHLLRPGQPLWAVAPAQEVRQIMLTFLINAADAVGEDGRIEVDATASDTEVWLRVRDDGKGFNSSQRLDRAVPFETTRAGEGGTGLGLSIAQTLAAEIGAEVRCMSDGPGTGSLFTLVIPIREESP
jgi:two-component system, NtrC family, sensor kinase